MTFLDRFDVGFLNFELDNDRSWVASVYIVLNLNLDLSWCLNDVVQVESTWLVVQEQYTQYTYTKFNLCKNAFVNYQKYKYKILPTISPFLIMTKQRWILKVFRLCDFKYIWNKSLQFEEFRNNIVIANLSSIFKINLPIYKIQTHSPPFVNIKMGV